MNGEIGVPMKSSPASFRYRVLLRMMQTAALFAALTAVASCGMKDQYTLPQVLDVPPYHGPWDMQKLTDKNPDPSIVEVDLEAKVTDVEYLPGKTTPAWAYNGSVPGPLIEAKVGDRVIVHFKNSLPDPTTIHWHGVRVPNNMDGHTLMMNPVPAGGSFDYSFQVQDAGTYWYHPHVRSDSQVEKGLYGALVVRAANEPLLTSERVVMLDDVYLDANGMPMPAGDMMELMIGRQGNLLLVNGKARPVLNLRTGERHRLRFINAANARYFRLSLPGHKLTLLGTDGGFIETPRELDELLLVPGERADVVISATAQPNAALDVVTLPYERGHDTGALPQANVLRVQYSAESAVMSPALPATLTTLAVLPTPVRTRRFVLSEQMMPMSSGHGGHGSSAGTMMPKFTINGQVYPNVPTISAKLGEVETWEVLSDEAMDHPLHIHGFSFQVLSRGGVPEPIRAWKDTVNIKGKETLWLAVRFDGFVGKWLYHCHILEHAENGMMGELDINP